MYIILFLRTDIQPVQPNTSSVDNLTDETTHGTVIISLKSRYTYLFVIKFFSYRSMVIGTKFKRANIIPNAKKPTCVKTASNALFSSCW